MSIESPKGLLYDFPVRLNTAPCPDHVWRALANVSITQVADAVGKTFAADRLDASW